MRNETIKLNHKRYDGEYNGPVDKLNVFFDKENGVFIIVLDQHMYALKRYKIQEVDKLNIDGLQKISIYNNCYINLNSHNKYLSIKENKRCGKIELAVVDINKNKSYSVIRRLYNIGDEYQLEEERNPLVFECIGQEIYKLFNENNVIEVY